MYDQDDFELSSFVTKIISVLKHLVPRPFRPAVRKCVFSLFPSLKYASRIQNELDTYTGIENVHDLPTIAHYWSEKYLIPIFEPFGFRNSVEFFRNYIGQVCVKNAGSTFVFRVSVPGSLVPIPSHTSKGF